MTVENWINLGMLIIAIISALIAAGSLWFAYEQWQKIKKKIGMISDSGRAFEILPAWYTLRMMGRDLGGGRIARDYWPFGLLLSDGRTLVLTRVISLSDDGKWMDVELCTKDDFSLDDNPRYVLAVGDDRRLASVQVIHVIAAIELAAS